MAVAVDKADLLANQIIRSFRPLRDTLVAIGLLYSMKNVIKLGYQIIRGAHVFGISQLRWRNFMKHYGEWAIVTGCTQGIGRAYVEELAKMKMNVILVSRNEDKLAEVARELQASY